MLMLVGCYVLALMHSQWSIYVCMHLLYVKLAAYGTDAAGVSVAIKVMSYCIILYRSLYLNHGIVHFHTFVFLRMCVREIERE